MIVPSFSGDKYETTMNIVGSVVKFASPYVNPETQMRSNQVLDWDHAIHYAMNHLSMKSDMKIFGTRGVHAVSNELRKLHLCN